MKTPALQSRSSLNNQMMDAVKSIQELRNQVQAQLMALEDKMNLTRSNQTVQYQGSAVN